MNKFFCFLLLLFCCTTNAQIHEIGVFAGGSNFVGDVGLTKYIAPVKPAIGIVYKWNKSPRLAYRFSLTRSLIYENDVRSKEPSRNQRGYYFKNWINEVSAGIEFNFFDFNLHETETKITPYVHSGLNYMSFNNSHLEANIVVAQERIRTFALPITLGVKSNIWPQLILALEAGARYTFTDNLDGSNPNEKTWTKFGNINNNDWYIFSGVTITYTFGEKPCYCSE
jgi:hypothetical protein